MSNTAVFTGGGPMSEFLRTIYQQVRSTRNIPPDPLLDDVEEIASRRPLSLAARNTINGQGQTTYKATMNSQYTALRTTFNRKFFVECNLHYFSADEVRKARQSFDRTKEDMENVLRYITEQVQNKLTRARWHTIGEI
jgi:hypothetical protein